MYPALLALFVTVTYPTVNSHELVLPLKNIPDINADYDQRRGYKRTHGAIDQNVTMGTPVRAVADGKVTKVYSMSSYMRETNRILRRIRRRMAKTWPVAKKQMKQCGCTWRIRRKSRGAWKAGVFISIEHTSDKGKVFKTQYMHLSKISVVLGKKVKRGQVIGLSGDTAIIDSNPHLHFQIRQDGIKQDPKKYIRALDGQLITKLKKLYKTFSRL